MPSERFVALAKSRWLELGEICNVWLTEYRMSASVLFVMFRRSKGEEVSRRDGDRCRNMLASPAGNVQILNSIAPVGASDKRKKEGSCFTLIKVSKHRFYFPSL